MPPAQGREVALAGRPALGRGGRRGRCRRLRRGGCTRGTRRSVASSVLVGEPVGDLVLVDVEVLGQVDDRLHRYRASGLPHQVRTWSAATGRVFATRARSSARSRGAGDGGLGEVHVQHHLTAAAPTPGAVVGSWSVARSRASWWRASSPSAIGAAHVQRLGRPEVRELGGTGGEGGVEVAGRRRGRPRPRPTRCRRRTPGRVQTDVPTVRGRLRGVGWPGRACAGRSPPRPAGPAGPADPVREPATWVSTNPAAPRSVRASVGRSGGPATPGPGQPGPGPGRGEPVPQLDRLGAQVRPASVAMAKRGGELGHRELRPPAAHPVRPARPRSRPRPPSTPPASASDSGAWMTAQSSAAWARPTSWASAAARCSRAAASTAAAVPGVCANLP